MTDQLGSNEYTGEFVCVGPKNYTYGSVNARTPDRKTV